MGDQPGTLQWRCPDSPQTTFSNKIESQRQTKLLTKALQRGGLGYPGPASWTCGWDLGGKKEEKEKEEGTSSKSCKSSSRKEFVNLECKQHYVGSCPRSVWLREALGDLRLVPGGRWELPFADRS